MSEETTTHEMKLAKLTSHVSFYYAIILFFQKILVIH